MASKSLFGRNDQSARYAAASLALGLMFVSLVVIYLTVPQSDAVTLLCIVIMAVSLIIALIGDWNEIGTMAALATLTSLMAAYFLGRDMLGDAGSIIVPLGWGGVLLYIFRWISSHTVVVPEDHAIMVARFYSGSLYRLQPPLAPPLIPLLERRVATIPLYELSHDVKVAKINTGGSHSIDEVEVHLRYRVKNPEFALANIPNRGQIQNEVAREMGRDLEQARLDVAFWEKLLARQLAHEVDDIVREVIFAETKSATDAYQKRQHISREVFRRLNELTQRWASLSPGPILIISACRKIVFARPTPMVRSNRKSNASWRRAKRKRRRKPNAFAILCECCGRRGSRSRPKSSGRC